MGRDSGLTEFLADEALSITFQTFDDQPTKMSSAIIPHDNDVLMGRGGKNNQHIGNEKLRILARQRCDNYRLSSKKGKSYISRELVKLVRAMSPPGRFLKKNGITGLWEDVGDEVAREKASQALRDAVSAQISSPTAASPELERSIDATAHYEHRRSSSDPCMTESVSQGKRQRNSDYIDNRGVPTQGYPMASRHSYSTPRDLPPVTPSSSTNTKRRRYHPPTTSYRYDYSNLQIPQSPIQVPPPNHMEVPSSRLPPRPAHHHYHYSGYPSQHSNSDPGFDSPGVILGEIQGETTDFDLFDGELLESEVRRAGHHGGYRRDTF